jgi:co-chaperonin GroES (HSP10)
MTIKSLRPDLVLVALPPVADKQLASGLILPANSDQVPQAGLVRQVGEKVTDVTPGDRVVFARTVGQEVDIDGWPHLLLRETDIDGVLER